MTPNFLAFLLFITSSFSHVKSLRFESVLGGHPPEPHSFKYQMTLNVKVSNGPDSIMDCAGALVHLQFGVSVANCVIARATFFERGVFIRRWYRVASGTHDFKLGNAILVDAEELYVPKEYNPETYEADIVVIKLKYPIDTFLFPRVQPIELPTEHTVDEGLLTAVASGYGLNRLHANGKGSTNYELNYVKQNVTSVWECKHWTPYPSDNTLCAKTIPDQQGQQWGLCRFDKGAPLVVGGVLIGLANRLRSNCVDTIGPTFYTRIKSYAVFIHSVITGLPLLGTRAYRGPFRLDNALLSEEI